MEVDAASAIHAQLGPHERLLWTGRPRRGLLFHPSDALVLPFGLVWLAFAVEGVGGADARHTSLVPQLLSVVCVLVGLFVIAGRFPLDALRRSAIYYGVTNERVLIVRLRYSAAVTAWRLRDLGGVAVIGKGDEGALTFDIGPNASRGLSRFERIPEARRVADIIRRAQSEA